jgi:hypothetical protein
MIDIQKIYRILPNNGKWKMQNNIVYVRYFAWIPIMNIEKDYIEVYFDTKLHRYLLKILHKLQGEELHLISPILHDPKNKYLSDEEIHKINILNMLSNYSNPVFFNGFQNIGFDLIEHLVFYCKKFNCMTLIKEAYDVVNKSVQSKEWDYYANKKFFTYTEEIREDFLGLYRQIKLAELLN